MVQIFGYRNLKCNPLDYQSLSKPDFYPVFDYKKENTVLFWKVNNEEEKKEYLFENSELFVIIQGNSYFRNDFFKKYPKVQPFQNEGTANIIANLYLNYGVDSISDLTGEFILIINEKKDNKLIIVRDKIGGRKLYYSILNDNLILSSNIKSLLKIPGISRDVNFSALESFIKLGYIIAPETIFMSINALEPGHLISCNQDNFKKITYWKLNAGDEIRMSRSEIREMLYEKIEENITLRTKPNEQIGIYLSGGIDSNTLLGVLSKKNNPSDITTMSIGYGEQFKDYHELNMARFSANHFGSTHHEVINGPEHINKNLCKMVWQFEQPFGNPALISWISLAELAKDFVDVVFVGAGPDEVLGGYNRHKALNFLKLYYRIPFYASIAKMFKSVFSNISVGANHYDLSYRLRKLFETIRPDILQTNEAILYGDYSSLREDLYDKKFLEKLNPEAPTLEPYYAMANTDEPFKKIFIADFYIDLVSEQFARSHIPLDVYNIDYRVPFSDPDFITMCLNIPDKYKANLYSTKIIYKEAVSHLLPSEIIKQKKRGMSHPVNLWFQDPLYEVLKSILSPDNTALNKYFNMNFLQIIAEEHYSKKNDWGNLLWKMIVFSMWHKVFLESKSTEMPDFSLEDLG